MSRNAMQCTQRRRRDKNPDARRSLGIICAEPQVTAHINIADNLHYVNSTGIGPPPGRRGRAPGCPETLWVDLGSMRCRPTCHPASVRPRLVSGLASDPMRPDSTRRRLYRIEPPARSARVPPDIHRRRPPRHAHCSCSQCADAARCGDTVSSSRAHRAVDHPNDAHAAARTHPVPRGAATTDRPFSPLPHLMDNHRYP